MKTKTYKYLLLVISFITSTASLAQQKHEFSITGGAGLSSFNYKTDFGRPSYQFGGFIGVGYSYFFSPNWGIGTGIEAAMYNARMRPDAFNSVENNLMDDEGDKFDFHSLVSNYSEQQRAIYLNVPIRLIYQTNGNTKFYASGGLKVGLPLYGHYAGSDANFVNKGYYFEIDNWFTTQRFRGFGIFTGRNVGDDLNLKPTFMVAAEAGIKWPLKNSAAVYTGLYFDYGLNDIIKDDRSQSFTKYNHERPAKFTNNSILTSSRTENGKSWAFTEKVVPFALGVKIAYVFGKCKSHIVEPIDPIPPVYKPEPVTPQQPETIIDNSEQERLAQAEEKRKVQEAERQRVVEEKRKQEEVKEDVRIFLEPIINFPIKITTMSEKQKAELNKRIALLKKYPHWYIICEGHTCNIGNETTNMKLGLQRAMVVKEYMAKHGIDGSRIGISSKGESNPMVPNTSEANHLKNRRVEFVVKQ